LLIPPATAPGGEPPAGTVNIIEKYTEDVHNGYKQRSQPLCGTAWKTKILNNGRIVPLLA
jgi:hypothetical protein